MDTYYYVDQTGQKAGPVSPMQFGMYGIQSNTLVWKAGMAQWTPAGTLPELQQFLAAGGSYGAAGSIFPPGYIPPKPDNNLFWAIASTVCCCVPLGIVAIVKSTEVNSHYYAGRYAEAIEAAESAKKWAIWAAVAGIIVSSVYGVAVSLVGPLS